MKNLFILATVLLYFNVANAQNSLNLIGKTFEYTDKYTNAKTQYTFLSNNKVKLVMLTESNSKQFKDICFCQSSIEGNRIKANCICEDKEIFPDPLKETFIYDPKTNTLTTTIYYDQNRKPQIYILK
jgi:hypothetical protein